jgi:hypothetical protein
MTNHQFHELLHSFCAVSGLDAEKLVENGLVTVDGMDMLLFHDEKNGPDQLRLRMDFGKCAPEVEARVMRMLMSANYTWGLGGFVFSAHPELGNLILTFAMPMVPHMTGEMLADELRRCVREARQCWDGIQNLLRDPKMEREMMGMLSI